jgi:PAS domain-containing protein
MSAAPGATGATMIVNADGRVADADQAALDMLGVTLEQLRALPPGSFNAEPPNVEREAEFRDTWERRDRPDLVGEATLKLLDGTKRRVKFVIAPVGDGRFRVVMEAAAGSVEQEPTVYTAGRVLGEWRAAERRLADLPPGSAEALAVQAEIDRFRVRYQAFFDRTV